MVVKYLSHVTINKLTPLRRMQIEELIVSQIIEKVSRFTETEYSLPLFVTECPNQIPQVYTLITLKYHSHNYTQVSQEFLPLRFLHCEFCVPPFSVLGWYQR
jgi:hypothetical protein